MRFVRLSQIYFLVKCVTYMFVIFIFIFSLVYIIVCFVFIYMYIKPKFSLITAKQFITYSNLPFNYIYRQEIATPETAARSLSSSFLFLSSVSLSLLFSVFNFKLRYIYYFCLARNFLSLNIRYINLVIVFLACIYAFTITI